VIVFPFSGAPVATRQGDPHAGIPAIDDYEHCCADAPAERLRAARRERPDRDVLHLGHDRPAEGRRVFAPVHGAAFAGRGPAGPVLRCPTAIGVSGHADVPRQCLGHAVRSIMVGAKLVFPGRTCIADDLLDQMQVDPPSLSLGVPTIWLTMIQNFEAIPGPLEAARRVCAAWSAARRCRSR
jgi:fatty-acyl-CoA synthase